MTNFYRPAIIIHSLWLLLIKYTIAGKNHRVTAANLDWPVLTT